MSDWVKLSIKGIQEEQAKNLKRIAMLKPGGVISRAIRRALVMAHRFAVALTHVGHYRVKGGGYVGGGTLRASHRIAFRESDTYGFIYIDPSAINPRSHQSAAVYGVYEHQRGGSHAFYGRVMDEYGKEIAKEGVDMILHEVTE